MAVTAAVLNIGNRGINRFALEAVDPKPDERVLDIGLGAVLPFVRRCAGSGPTVESRAPSCLAT
jgi:hypothetical protein